MCVVRERSGGDWCEPSDPSPHGSCLFPSAAGNQNPEFIQTEREAAKGEPACRSVVKVLVLVWNIWNTSGAKI